MRSISALDRFAESIRAAVTRGFDCTSAGHLHSSETATSESIRPRSATISVALGSSEQTRVMTWDLCKFKASRVRSDDQTRQTMRFPLAVAVISLTLALPISAVAEPAADVQPAAKRC